MRAISYFRMRVLSVSLTDQVPKLAANVRVAAANSASVAPARRLLVSLNLGRLGCPSTVAYRPLASRIRMPFGLAPKSCRLAPSGGVVSLETTTHDPTSCSLSVFCWAIAPPVSAANPNAAMAENVSTLCTFIEFLLSNSACDVRTYDRIRPLEWREYVSGRQLKVRCLPMA